MTNAGQIQQINTLLDAARVAIANRDAIEASWLATSLSLELATIPDGKKDGSAGAELSFDREAINNTINQLRTLGRNQFRGGIAVSQVQYTRGDCR